MPSRQRPAAETNRQLSLPLLSPDSARLISSTDGRRVATLAGEQISWALHRSRRRTIGFQIDHRGLRVTAPRWVSIVEVEGALQEKAHWVVRKLAEWRQHEARRESMAIRWEHGAPLRVLGETLIMQLDSSLSGVHRVGSEVRIGLPPQANSEQLKDRVESWLRERARTFFAERIPVFSERLGIAPTRWMLSSARTRWGSCNPDGSIRLNWRLVHFPPDIVDYVIAHELAHLRELNHGPRFWATVGELFPDFERARGWLRTYSDDTPVG